jgi:hypothetical protein
MLVSPKRETCTEFPLHQRIKIRESKQMGRPSDYGDDYEEDRDSIHFADLGGKSALRAATKRNPRNLPCPNCGAKNRLTPADRALGYQCDSCADKTERGCD